MNVEIAPQASSIVAVTAEAVVYRSADGALEQVWLAEAEDAGCPEHVGHRSLLKPPYWVRIGPVQFEFESAQAAYTHLLEPLEAVGRLAPKEPWFDLRIKEDSWWNLILYGVVVGSVWALSRATDRLWVDYGAIGLTGYVMRDSARLVAKRLRWHRR